jgi:hypothetical protein
MRRLSLGIVALLAAGLASAELSDRHELTIGLDWHLTDTDSTLGAWPDAGYGKLRFDSEGGVEEWSRLAVEYRGRIAPELFAHAVLDYIDDASEHVGLTEAYLEWRPLPTGANRHRFRFGAFYPAFSHENSDIAWESPYTRSFSAINAWLGEEIRPVGADWRLTRRLGAPASGLEIGVVGGVFFGNDPAGTLLFWRGWAVHDRQTRLNERLPLPPLVFPAAGNGPDTVIERELDPIAEIDDEPGFYLGGKWHYARRARLSLAFWDNRGDPTAFRDGQWAWGTRFWQLGGQFELPGKLGLIAQHMRGDTDWLTYVTTTGMTTPQTALETDEFESSFVLLSRMIGKGHRLSLRLDDFDLWRPGKLEVDRGDATTVAYDYAINARFRMRLEWLRIESSRDLWPIFYDQTSHRFAESLVQLGLRVVLLDTRT